MYSGFELLVTNEIHKKAKVLFFALIFTQVHFFIGIEYI